MITSSVFVPTANQYLDTTSVKSYTELYSSSRGGAVVARRAHNPKVVGSNPTPATKVSLREAIMLPLLLINSFHLASDLGIPTHLGVLSIYLR